MLDKPVDNKFKSVQACFSEKFENTDSIRLTVTTEHSEPNENTEAIDLPKVVGNGKKCLEFTSSLGIIPIISSYYTFKISSSPQQEDKITSSAKKENLINKKIDFSSLLIFFLYFNCILYYLRLFYYSFCKY